MITPFYDSAEHERAKEILNFTSRSQTLSQATCTRKHLHGSRRVTKRHIKDFQDVRFKNKLTLRQGQAKHTMYKDDRPFITGTF